MFGKIIYTGPSKILTFEEVIRMRESVQVIPRFSYCVGQLVMKAAGISGGIRNVARNQ